MTTITSQLAESQMTSIMANDLKEQGCSDHLVDQVANAREFTVQDLDAIAKALQADESKPVDRQKQWNDEFAKRVVALADMFDDGEDVIILAKLADQLPRMFEKMRDNVQDQAMNVKNELTTARRGDVGIELTQNKIDDLEEKMAKMRRQWANLNNAFHVILNQARPKIISNAGFSFNGGKYTTLKDLPRVIRKNVRNRHITIEAYRSNPELCYQMATEIGLVELPDDQK